MTNILTIDCVNLGIVCRPSIFNCFGIHQKKFYSIKILYKKMVIPRPGFEFLE